MKAQHGTLYSLLQSNTCCSFHSSGSKGSPKAGLKVFDVQLSPCACIRLTEHTIFRNEKETFQVMIRMMTTMFISKQFCVLFHYLQQDCGDSLALKDRGQKRMWKNGTGRERGKKWGRGGEEEGKEKTGGGEKKQISDVHFVLQCCIQHDLQLYIQTLHTHSLWCTVCVVSSNSKWQSRKPRPYSCFQINSAIHINITMKLM